MCQTDQSLTDTEQKQQLKHHNEDKKKELMVFYSQTSTLLQQQFTISFIEIDSNELLPVFLLFIVNISDFTDSGSVSLFSAQQEVGEMLSGVQVLGVVFQVLAQKGVDEEVAVVVALQEQTNKKIVFIQASHIHNGIN